MLAAVGVEADGDVELLRLLSAERVGRPVRITLVRIGQRVETQAVPSELEDR